MSFDGKSAPIKRAVPDRVWKQVRRLLDLPEYARDDFEGIVINYLKRIERKNRAKGAPNIETLCDEHTVMFTPDWLGIAFALQCGHGYGRTVFERAFVRELAEIVERYKGTPPQPRQKVAAKIGQGLRPDRPGNHVRRHRGRVKRPSEPFVKIGLWGLRPIESPQGRLAFRVAPSKY